MEENAVEATPIPQCQKEKERQPWKFPPEVTERVNRTLNNYTQINQSPKTG